MAAKKLGSIISSIAKKLFGKKNPPVQEKPSSPEPPIRNEGLTATNPRKRARSGINLEKADIGGRVSGISLDKSTAPPKQPPANVSRSQPAPNYTNIPANIVLTDEFRNILDLIENTSQNLFITGKPGTGKSSLIRLLKSYGKKIHVVVAPTGIAALNVGGKTIHSFFRFPLKILTPEDIKKDYKKLNLLKDLQTLVIDEVSMVRADLMDAIDAHLRFNRNKKNLPFGGVQVILFGDPLQLPPVIKTKEEELYLEDKYGGPFFFQAPAYRQGNFRAMELTRVFRQTDQEFLKLLNAVRENTIGQNELDAINERYKKTSPVPGMEINLCAKNDDANKINDAELAKLKEPEFSYAANIYGAVKPGDYPTDDELVLKKGAHVMLLKNDPAGRWVNGTLGRVDDLRSDLIKVMINGIAYQLERENWEFFDFEYNKEEKKIVSKLVGTFTQYPLKLAWAITIHKSQGQTFPKIAIDLGRGAFAHGQTYVALSRCTTLEGITLNSRISADDIRLDDRVCQFASSIGRP